MRIFLVLVLIFLINMAPVYGIRPLNDTEIDKEKERIAENIMPVREERERTLHPFVRTDVDQDISGADIRLRKSPYGDFRSRIGTEPKRGVNFLFLSLIAIAFLLSYFFIRPKST